MRSRALNNLSVDGGGETIGTGGTMRRGRRRCVPPSVRRRALPEFKTGSSRQLSSISFSARPAASSSLQRGVSLTSSPPALGQRVCAAMVPCMTLYAILGKRLEKAGIEDDNPYREWVETYASEEFWEAKEQAEGLLDVLTPHGCERCGELYAEAMRLEHAFFAAQDVASDWIRLTSSFRARLEASLSGASLRAGAEMEL